MFNRNALLLTAMVVSFPVFAQSPGAAPVMSQPSREAARIAGINERIAVMSAELAELEMQAKISSKRAEIDKTAEAGKATANIDDSFIPSVNEINGIDGRIWAVLNVAGGNTQTVRVGDRVGAWRVTQILPDSVTVKQGNDAMRLAFGFNTPQPQPQASGAQLPGVLPPFPR